MSAYKLLMMRKKGGGGGGGGGGGEQNPMSVCIYLFPKGGWGWDECPPSLASVYKHGRLCCTLHVHVRMCVIHGNNGGNWSLHAVRSSQLKV